MHPSRARPGRPRAREEAAALTLDPLTIYPRSTSKLGALAAYLLRARTEAERDQAYPTPSAMAHDGPLLTQQPAQPHTPTTAQRNGARGRRSRASGFDSPGGHWVATHRRETMAQYRYSVTCRECGEIEADSEDGLFSKATAHRRAGFHEKSRGHDCDVEISEETNEYRCPVCHTKCVGERERDKHAKSEPGVHPSSFVRV